MMKTTGNAMDNGELFCNCCGDGCYKAGKTLRMKRMMESIKQNGRSKKKMLKIKLFSDDVIVTVSVKVRDISY